MINTATLVNENEMDNTGFIIRRYMLDMDFSKTELLVYGLISSYTQNNGLYWGTLKSLAKDLRLSQRSVYRAVSSLSKRGLIAESKKGELGGLACTDKIVCSKKKEKPEY